MNAPGIWRRARGWLVDIAIVVAAIAAISAWQSRKLLPADAEPAPEFALRDLDGQVVRLEELAGQPVQLHFWGTWCPVCRREHAALNAVHRATASDAVLLAIAVDSGSAADLRAYAADKGLTYRVLIDETGEVASAYRVSSFPTNYYLDRDLRIVGRDVGMATRWGMRWHLHRAGRSAAAEATAQDG